MRRWGVGWTAARCHDTQRGMRGILKRKEAPVSEPDNLSDEEPDDLSDEEWAEIEALAEEMRTPLTPLSRERRTVARQLIGGLGRNVAQCYQLLGLDPTYTEQDLVLVLGEIETAVRRTRIYLDSPIYLKPAHPGPLTSQFQPQGQCRPIQLPGG